MKKITLQMFKTLIVNNCNSTYQVPSIKNTNIKEFKIGKSYFYTIKNKSKFQIKYPLPFTIF